MKYVCQGPFRRLLSTNVDLLLQVHRFLTKPILIYSQSLSFGGQIRGCLSFPLLFGLMSFFNYPELFLWILDCKSSWVVYWCFGVKELTNPLNLLSHHLTVWNCTFSEDRLSFSSNVERASVWHKGFSNGSHFILFGDSSDEYERKFWSQFIFSQHTGFMQNELSPNCSFKAGSAQPYFKRGSFTLAFNRSLFCEVSQDVFGLIADRGL